MFEAFLSIRIKAGSKRVYIESCNVKVAIS